MINLSIESDNLPNIKNTDVHVLSRSTAYQMASILQGTVERGTAKEVKFSWRTHSW